MFFPGGYSKPLMWDNIEEERARHCKCFVGDEFDADIPPLLPLTTAH